MINRKFNTPFYIVLSFISPIVLAWIMSQTKFATDPSATTNHGMLINQESNWLLSELKTPKTKMWKIIALTSEPSQCQRMLEHADASIILLNEQAKRVHLFTSDICQNIKTQSPSSTMNTAAITNNLTTFFPKLTESSYYELIVDPQDHVTLIYTDKHGQKDLMKDLQVLLKYSKVG
jgi:hypothetical protein